MRTRAHIHYRGARIYNVVIFSDIARNASFHVSSMRAREALGHDKNGKPFCIDPNAPISAQARRNFTWEVCKFCQKKKNKNLEETQKKEEDHRKPLEKLKKQNHESQKRVNETLENQKTVGKSSPADEFGMCGY